MQKMKILVVSGTPPPYSGPEIMTANLLNSPLKDQYQLIHFNISKGRGVNEKARFDLFNIAYGIVQPFILFWLLIYHRPHLVYTNLAQNLGGFLRYASFILPTALFRIPIVVRTMGDGFHHFYERSGRVWRLLIRTVLNLIDGFIVRADLLKVQYQDLVPQEKIHTVYSGVDTTEFVCTQRSPADRFNILFVGYLTKAKGAHDLLQAVPLVAQKHPHVRFRLMGERVDIERNITYIDNPRSNKQQLDNLLSRPDIAPYVELLGVLSGKEKSNAFCSAQLFVFPSYSEAFPTVVLEAMAAELPIIATPVGALPEVFNDQHINYVEYGDIDAIANAICWMIEHPRSRIEQAKRNKKLILQKFDLNSHAQAVSNIFQTFHSH